jgi:hypothetical protein
MQSCADKAVCMACEPSEYAGDQQPEVVWFLLVGQVVKLYVRLVQLINTKIR